LITLKNFNCLSSMPKINGWMETFFNPDSGYGLDYVVAVHFPGISVTRISVVGEDKLTFWVNCRDKACMAVAEQIVRTIRFGGD